MKHFRPHKKDLRPKIKDNVEDRFHHGRLIPDKVKYKYKNHWLEAEEEVIVGIKKMKKIKG